MRLGHGVDPHRLGDSGNFAIADLARRLGRDVGKREATASAGQHDVRTGIAAGHDRIRDRVDVVFHDHARQHGPALLGDELLEAAPAVSSSMLLVDEQVTIPNLMSMVRTVPSLASTIPCDRPPCGRDARRRSPCRVDRLAHIVNREQGDAHPGESLHLDAGLSGHARGHGRVYANATVFALVRHDGFELAL